MECKKCGVELTEESICCENGDCCKGCCNCEGEDKCECGCSCDDK